MRADAHRDEDLPQFAGQRALGAEEQAARELLRDRAAPFGAATFANAHATQCNSAEVVLIGWKAEVSVQLGRGIRRAKSQIFRWRVRPHNLARIHLSIQDEIDQFR